MNPAPRDEHAPYDSDALLHGWLSDSSKIQSPACLVRVDARALADAEMGIIEHATLILERTQPGVAVRFADATHHLPESLQDHAMPVLTLHEHLLMPALVNAHTHLDLTHIGPQPHEPGDGFVQWVDMIRTNRASEDEHITDCVRLGIEHSLEGGVIAVGDIAGAPAGRLTESPARTLSASPLMGVSFLEFFGIGKTAPGAIQRVEAFLRDRLPSLQDALEGTGIRFGLQPHATNTIDLGVYRWVAKAAAHRGIPTSTHLAETPEEREFIAHATGSQRELLQRLGVWDDAILDTIAKGKHPIEHLEPVLETHPMLVAHVNDATDRGIEILAKTHTSVAYCPRASSYFGAESHFGPHRYRDMLEAGVNVCLGTDSIVNLDTHDRMSTLDDMRLLWSRGDRDAKRLLAMGTRNGARSLGLDPAYFSLKSGAQPAGILAIKCAGSGASTNPFKHAMDSKSAPTWVYRGS
jgi:cytosine/adenosine deaminase-related metal-dependent hydrolase